ncbi:hypothetical protein, partial [uncultured Bacteroides sp.]|uniref:hypothetical protein n=1 Tax=uncultured Bacteroides sp. TaxID=162156 RepID=UPI002639B311
LSMSGIIFIILFNGDKFRKNVFNMDAKSSISKKKLNFVAEFLHLQTIRDYNRTLLLIKIKTNENQKLAILPILKHLSRIVHQR